MASKLLNLSSSPVPRYFIFAFLVVLLFDINSVAIAEDPLAQQAVTHTLERIKKQTGVGAVAYALVENNDIIAMGGIGEYGLDNKRPVTEASMFRVGSITKTFTSLAVMRLVEQGKLQLDQSVKTIALISRSTTPGQKHL